MSPEQRAQLQELSNSLLDDMDLRWQMDQLGQNLRNAFPQMGWGQGMRFRGDEPLPLVGHGQPARPARRHRRAREPDAQRDQPRSARRGRPRPRARPPRRRRGAFAATARGAREGCSRRPGSSSSAKAAWSSRPRASAASASARSAISSSACCRTAPAATRSSAPVRPRTLQRPQDVRVRRPAAPRRRAHAQERDHARRFGHAGADHARRLRDRAHRAGHARGDGVDARRLALDGDARPVPRGQEGRDGAARAHHLAVPARLSRHGQLRARRPRGEARAPPRGHVGLRVGHQHAARARCSPARCCRRRAAASRSS